MTASRWILCEQSTRWAAALRLELSRTAAETPWRPTLHEVRSLSELTSELGRYPDSLVLFEVTLETLEATLSWLVSATNRGEQSAAIALLDHPRNDLSHHQLFDESSSASRHRDIAATALREVGAMDVIDSPRQVGLVLAAGQRHAKKMRSYASRQPDAENSLESWAWSLLPWQDTGHSVG